MELQLSGPKGRLLITHTQEAFTRGVDGFYKPCSNNGKIFEVEPTLIAAKEI